MPVDRRLTRGGFVTAAAALAATAAPLRAQGLTPLTFYVASAPPDPTTHYNWWASENGFYKDLGLDVTIKTIAGDTTLLRALVAGEADVASIGSMATLAAIQGGAPLNVLDCFIPRLDFRVIASKEVPNLKAFEGKPFAVSTVGSVSQLAPAAMIEQAGGDPSKVQWVNVGGNAARVQALIGKRVLGAAVNASLTALALRNEGIHQIGDCGQALPNFIYAWDVVSSKTYTAKKAALQNYTLATARGVRWAMANPEKAVAISQKLLPNQPPELVAADVTDLLKRRFYSTDGVLARAAWDYTAALAAKINDAKTRLAYDQVVLADVARGVAGKLGPAR